MACSILAMGKSLWIQCFWTKHNMKTITNTLIYMHTKQSVNTVPEGFHPSFCCIIGQPHLQCRFQKLVISMYNSLPQKRLLDSSTLGFVCLDR